MFDVDQPDAVTMASQRPAYAVRPPMLARHTIFRIGEDAHPHLPETGPARSDRWAEILTPINEYVDELHAAFGFRTRRRFRVVRNDRPGAHGPGAIELIRASETLICELCPATADRPRSRLRIDVHSEILTLTHLVDHIPPGSELGEKLIALDPSDVEYFYDAFWRDDFLPPSHPVRFDEILQKLGKFGRPYAEFRGVGLGLTPDDQLPLAGQEAFVRPEAHEDAARQGVTPAIAAFLHKKQDFLRTLVTSADQTEAALGAATTEAVVCGMLDGQALYASSLADRPGIVRYLAAYDGYSPSQLGRFIRRLHTLGELRLSALIDLNEDRHGDRERSIRRVSQKIRRLGIRVDRALMSRKALNAKQIGTLSSAHAAASTRTIDSDIIYRVERSRYYASALENRIKDLRIVRIEGWQPYDAFVRRYHSQDHDFIAGVGRRYRALGQRIDRLMFLHQARKSEDYQEELTGAVKEIQNLQVRAEDIAILAGGYYGSQALSHAAHLDLIAVAGGFFVAVMLIDMLILKRRIRGALGLCFEMIAFVFDILLKRVDEVGPRVSERLRHSMKDRLNPPAAPAPPSKAS